MPRRRNNALSLKEKAFVSDYLTNGGNATQAAMETYNTKKRDNAKHLAYKVLKRPQVQQEIKTILDNNRLSVNEVTKLAHKGILKGLNEGKPSFAAAMSMLQFNYKLHNVVPANKSLKASVVLNQDTSSKNFDELKELLTKQAQLTNKLLENFSK